MLDEGVRHLPVMAGADLVGIVSMRDVLRVFTDSWRRTHHQS
jgi:CBS domain-containing protein